MTSVARVSILGLVSAARLLIDLGLVVRLAAVYGLGRVVARSLYEMRAADPPVLLGAGTFVTVVTRPGGY